jgi:hypothetical protein
MDEPSELLHLAHTISDLTAQVNKRIAEPDLSSSYGLSDIPGDAEFEAIRSSLNEAIQDLQLVINGPKTTLRSLYGSHYDLAAHQVALEFNFFKKVPLEGTISVHALADSTRLSPDVVGRVLRLLATQRVFCEDRKNEFAHTILSATIAKEENLEASFHMQMDEVFQAASETAKYLRQSPSTFDGAHCPFSMRFQMPIFEYYKQNPEKGERFGKALAGATQRM